MAGYSAETEAAGGRNARGNPCARGRPFRCAAKEENRRLYTAMNRLSPADRELLIWHYFGELSIRQMAGLRGISETAVKTALFRARARLKQKLGGEKP